MNKKLLLTLSAFSLLLLGSFAFISLNEDRVYTPRVTEVEGASGYAQYLATVRGNEHTGTVAQEDVLAVLDEIKEQSSLKQKVDWPLKWEFKGPDNFGGRTRCLVIDKDDPNVMYTGGVSGAAFKTTNKGASWRPLTINDDNFGIVSMVQASDGSIIYGTGEGSYVGVTGGENGTPGFNGFGMFKSTDGETFAPIAGSTGFGNINVMERHPVSGDLYAGTSGGLRRSTDNGESWDLIRPGNCRDVKFNKDGITLAYIGGVIYRSTDATIANSYEILTALGGSSRSGIAWSDSDPDFCYVVSVASITFDGQTYNSALSGLWKSSDAGVTWTKEVNQISKFFPPFTIIGLQSQGTYNLAIAVHPRDKDRVFVGGIDFAEWTADAGPKIVGNRFDSPTNPFGIHSDKHYITFDNSGDVPIMYICNDGGISKTTNDELTNYTDISRGLITTQFYGIAADINGKVLGGTQDQSTMYLENESFPRKRARTVLGGDGFHCEISQFDPEIMFAESQYGNLRRSVNGGDDMLSIWDNRISSSFASSNRPTGYFSNAFDLWENPNVVDSVTTRGANEGDEILVDGRIYFATNNGVWMCKNAFAERFDPVSPDDTSMVRWFRVSTVRSVHSLETTLDGNSLFITTTNGNVFRIDSLLTAQFDTLTLPDANQISPTLRQTEITDGLSVGSRTVTSVAIDANDPNRVVATVGNYNNTNYVYITENALDVAPTWRSIQGNLPRFPVYHAVISSDDPDVIILGTEFGVWATSNGSSATPTWAESLEGVNSDEPLPRCPVFDVVQVKSKTWSGPSIYAGTHGMGIWESISLLTNVREEPTATVDKKIGMVAYPNPAKDVVRLNTDIKGDYTLTVYNMSGQRVLNTTGANNGTISISVESLVNGNYFVEVIGRDAKAVSKLIVQH